MLAFFDNSAVTSFRASKSPPHGPTVFEDARYRSAKHSLFRPLRGRQSSVLMKHGPIEAGDRIDLSGRSNVVFRADEARPH